MNLLFVLSRENLELSSAEVRSLAKVETELIDRYLILDTKWNETFKRLAYTKEIHELLFIGKHIESDLKSYDWNQTYRDNFSLTAHGALSKKQKQYADIIYEKLDSPKVKLKGSSTEIHLFETEKGVIVSRLIYKQTENFNKRNPNSWKEFHPSTLKPRLARAMINLTGVREGEIIDPCCGAGGFLIEAGMMGIDAKGYDIDQVMVNRAMINLEQFGFKYKVMLANSLLLNEVIEYLVTDLPYAKNTKNISEEFYQKFIAMLSKNLKGCAVVGFPDSVDAKEILERFKLNLIDSFDYILHKALTKKIFIIESCV